MVIVIHPFIGCIDTQCLSLELSFFLHIISLRKWFDNKAKNEALLKMIQSLQTKNEQLADSINAVESQTLTKRKH